MKIKLEKHKHEWKYLFQIEKENLIGVLGPEKVRVEHIGSTSIPGLSAKPIIDIMIGVEDENQLNNYINKIIPLGYVYVKNYEKLLPLRRYFFKLADENIDMPKIINFSDDPEKYDSGSYQHKFHIHMVKFNSNFWKDHLLFRNYLLKNKDARLEYNQLKNKLVLKEWVNINDYTKSKSFFIRETLNRALDYEFNNTKRINRAKRGQISREELNDYRGFTTHELFEMLNDNPQKRTISASILGERQDTEAIIPLCMAFKREKALYSRIAISEALSQIGDPAVGPLIDLLGMIGKNQETELPQKYFNKESNS